MGNKNIVAVSITTLVVSCDPVSPNDEERLLKAVANNIVMMG